MDQVRRVALLVALTVVTIAGTFASRPAFASTVTGSAGPVLGTTDVRSTTIAVSLIEPSSPPSQVRSPAEFPTDTSRLGGSDPAPAPGKPGWVWWVSGAFVVMLVAGVFRLWRNGAFKSADVADGAYEADGADEADVS